MSVAGLVLAAGGGTRFGASPKQLADFHGRPLLEWAVRAQCDVAELSRVVVVLGSHADARSARAWISVAPRRSCALTGSPARRRRCGAGWGPELGRDVAKVIVTLGDAPLVTPEVIRMFAGQPPRTRAVYDGRPGHPVVLGPEEIAALTSLTGDDGRARSAAGRTQ